jgi:hypothetical protein
MVHDAFAEAVHAVQSAAHSAPSIAGLDPAQVSLLGGGAQERVVDGVMADLEHRTG